MVLCVRCSRLTPRPIQVVRLTAESGSTYNSPLCWTKTRLPAVDNEIFTGEPTTAVRVRRQGAYSPGVSIYKKLEVKVLRSAFQLSRRTMLMEGSSVQMGDQAMQSFESKATVSEFCTNSTLSV